MADVNVFEVHVSLTSGKRKKFEISGDTTLNGLKALSQHAFNCGLLKIFSTAYIPIPCEEPLSQFNVSEFTAVVVPVTMAASFDSFAMYTYSNIVTWGKSVIPEQLDFQMREHKICKVATTDYAFAAVLGNGSVVSWGKHHFGSDSSLVQHRLKKVKDISATRVAFCALLEDGTVVTWGHPEAGGIDESADSSRVQDSLQNVKTVYPNGYAFAALLENGTVVPWGEIDSGGSLVSDHIKKYLKNVQTIAATNNAFAAIRIDGSVITSATFWCRCERSCWRIWDFCCNSSGRYCDAMGQSSKSV
jgi:hypothetical protein